MNKIKNWSLTLLLFLVISACTPKEVQVINRMNPEELSLHTWKSKNMYIRDTSLTQYLGKWESDELTIFFDSVVRVDFNTKRRVTLDELKGRLIITGDKQNTVYTIGAGSVGRQVLSIYSDVYMLNSDVILDTTVSNPLNWYKPGIVREALRIIYDDTTEVNSYHELPSHIVLTRIHNE